MTLVILAPLKREVSHFENVATTIVCTRRTKGNGEVHGHNFLLVVVVAVGPLSELDNIVEGKWLGIVGAKYWSVIVGAKY